MDGASAVGQSVEAINQILQMANKESIEMAEKLMKVAVEMGLEVGKGENFDAVA